MPSTDGDRLVTDGELERALSRSLREVLDLKNWDENAGLEKLATAIPRFVASSAENDRRYRETIRSEVFRCLHTFSDAPKHAGVYTVQDQHLRDVYRNCLLCGDVEAVNGVSATHEGVAAALVAIGICLVRYDGKVNSWRTTFLRHDQPLKAENVLQEIREVLDRRSRRSPAGSGPGAGRDRLTYLLRRGVMAAAERKTLLNKAKARWRMGHGMPAPLELLTGSGSMSLIDETLPVLDRLLLQHTRWIFVLSPGSNFALATMANALEKGQIAIFQKGKAALDDILERGHFSHGYRRKVEEFALRLGEVMVVGGFRATQHAPGQVFLAHTEHSLAAAVLAMADACLQPLRGFPLLLDLAALSARVFLGMEAFQGMVESAYAKAGMTHLLAMSS
ncbi:MAG TPA: hypothetical protein VG099_31455 [Gemmataceae bacterium]|nr:hypothetical protein [Gemmataceae bacterium]